MSASLSLLLEVNVPSRGALFFYFYKKMMIYSLLVDLKTFPVTCGFNKRLKLSAYYYHVFCFAALLSMLSNPSRKLPCRKTAHSEQRS